MWNIASTEHSHSVNFVIVRFPDCVELINARLLVDYIKMLFNFF